MPAMASPQAFETQEYYKSGGLDIINAAQAYSQGYTGKGITLGIADSLVDFEHSEFGKKDIWSADVRKAYFRKLPGARENERFHGTHVGGIMAANKDGKGMHGVAFDANLYSVEVFMDNNAYGKLNDAPGVKVVNNSWGFGAYIEPMIAQEIFARRMNELMPALKIIDNSMVKYDKLQIFSAGNAGHAEPDINIVYQTFLKKTNPKNIINVVAINPNGFDKKTNTAGTNFVSIFSDLAKYADERTIVAPGTRIYSSIPAELDKSGYAAWNGTSMATPYVSGAAGLVQQAFPYMTAAQIAETLLTTANKSFTKPLFVVTDQSDNGNYNVKLHYFGQAPDYNQSLQDLKNYYAQNVDILKEQGYNNEQIFISYWKQNYATNTNANVPYEVIFGQGLLDVGKAVKGPAALNARMMDRSNFKTWKNTGHAQMIVSTGGHNSEWSNDIGEIRAGLMEANATGYFGKMFDYYDKYPVGKSYIQYYNKRTTENGLINMPVGLHKTGEGMLTLSGNNSYTGLTSVDNGILQINGSIAGDCAVSTAGIISGNGIIGGGLYSNGTIRAGRNNGVGVLTVNQDMRASGNIAVAANSLNDYSKIKILGNAVLDNAKFTAVQGSNYLDGNYAGVISAANITGAIIKGAFSGMLTSEGILAADKKSMDMVLKRENNIPNLNSDQLSTYELISAMYDDATIKTKSAMIQLANLSPDEADDALTEIDSSAQLNGALLIQRDTMLTNAIGARLNSIKRIEKMQVSFSPPGAMPQTPVLNAIIPIELDNNNSWWFKTSKNWFHLGARNDLPSMNSQSTGIVIGADKKIGTNQRTGFVVSYGTMDAGSSIEKTTSRNYQAGIYSAYEKDAVSADIQLLFGKQKNNSQRHLNYLNLRADSKYDSRTLGFKIGAKYNLHHKQGKHWEVSPYVEASMVRYNQDPYTETGADIFNKSSDGWSNTYKSGEFGIEVSKKMKQGIFGLKLGYKKIFSGIQPAMDIIYDGSPGNKIMDDGYSLDRQYFTTAIRYERQMNKDWQLGGEVNGEFGSNSRSLTASLTFKKTW